MKRFERVRYVVGTMCILVYLSGCGGIRKLAETNPEVKMQLPAKLPEDVYPAAARDTVPKNKIITFKKQDGTEAYFVPTTLDTLTGQKMISLAIDEVVITTSSRRNLVERNGKINIEFVVTVPEALQHKDWRLVLEPAILKQADTLFLNPLVYTGDKFRAIQGREYANYDDYCDRIVDSADFFAAFGNRRVYENAMAEVTREKQKCSLQQERLLMHTPREAVIDPEVSWFSVRDFRAGRSSLKRYVRGADRTVARNTIYSRNEKDKYDHLNDYLSPRYRYEVSPLLPGGEYFTRIEGQYPSQEEQAREFYFRMATDSAKALQTIVGSSDIGELSRMAAERLCYTGIPQSWWVTMLQREMGDSAIVANYYQRNNDLKNALDYLNNIKETDLQATAYNVRRINRNEQLRAQKGETFTRLVRFPYRSDARLDTIIYKVDGSVQYHYVEQVQADENTSKLHLYLCGAVGDLAGRRYLLPKSDTLTYSVASMTNFLDETPRYMQRVITRDAEANARFYFTFPSGVTKLDEQLPGNRQQLMAVRDLTRRLMTDPVYIIDSITLRATASPEGTWTTNDRLARERAGALKQVVISEFRTLYDSLKVALSYGLDEQGGVIKQAADENLPNLPNLLHSEWLAEDWDELRRLVAIDTVITDKEGLLAEMDKHTDPDVREWRVRMKYAKAYLRMRDLFYPQMRAVDFRFNLHRRGMQQDTVYTTEIDSNYMYAVGLLKKRRYEEALDILRSYDDRNAALAYMSLGYDRAAYRILQAEPTGNTTSDIQYMLAILASRLGDEEQAVRYFLRSVELKPSLKFRGNLDPEVSRLIRKYDLFKEDW